MAGTFQGFLWLSLIGGWVLASLLALYRKSGCPGFYAFFLKSGCPGFYGCPGFFMAARSGLSLTAEQVVKNPEGLDLPALLERIESEMGTAAPEVQWTVNFSLEEIGIHFPDQRERALAIGEALGLYRNYPVSKGCTSPLAPIGINAMVNR